VAVAGGGVTYVAVRAAVIRRRRRLGTLSPPG
jgi:hypothetical protein